MHLLEITISQISFTPLASLSKRSDRLFAHGCPNSAAHELASTLSTGDSSTHPRICSNVGLRSTIFSSLNDDLFATGVFQITSMLNSSRTKVGKNLAFMASFHLKVVANASKRTKKSSIGSLNS